MPEDLCHKPGYFHFDLVAAWTLSESALENDKPEGFRGRVTREDWEIQVCDHAAGQSAARG